MSSNNKDNIAWHKMGDFLFQPNQPIQLPILIPDPLASGNQIFQEQRASSETSLNKKRKDLMELVLKGLDNIQRGEYESASTKFMEILRFARESYSDELNMNAFTFNGFGILFCYSCLKNRKFIQPPNDFVTDFNRIFNYKFVRYLEILANLKNRNYQYSIDCINRLKSDSNTAPMLHITYNNIDLFDEEIIPEVNVGILNKNIEIIGLYCLLCQDENLTLAGVSDKPIAFLEELLNVLSEGFQKNTPEINSKYKDKIEILKKMSRLPKNKQILTNIIHSKNMFETIIKLINDKSFMEDVINKDQNVGESKSSKRKKRKNRQKDKAALSSETAANEKSDTLYNEQNKEDNSGEISIFDLNTKETKNVVSKDIPIDEFVDGKVQSEIEDKKIVNSTDKNVDLQTRNNENKEDAEDKNNKVDVVKNKNMNFDDLKDLLNASMKMHFDELAQVYVSTKNDITKNVSDKLKNNEVLLLSLMTELKDLKMDISKMQEDKNTTISNLKEEQNNLKEELQSQIRINVENSRIVAEKNSLINSLQNRLRELERNLNDEKSKNSELSSKYNQYLEDKFQFFDEYCQNLIDKQISALEFLNDIHNSVPNDVEPNFIKLEISNKSELLTKLCAAHNNIFKDRGTNIPLKFPILFDEETQSDFNFFMHFKELLINNINPSTATDTEGARSLAFLDYQPRTDFQSDLSKEKSIHEFLTENLKSATSDEIADALIKLSENEKVLDMSNEEILNEVRNILEIETCCTICLEDLSSFRTTRLQCRHIFHKKCIGSWFRGSTSKSCPICRESDEFPAL